MTKRGRRHSGFIPDLRGVTLVTAFCIALWLVCSPVADAAAVVIVGDTQYSVVAAIASEIQLSLRSAREYNMAEVKGKLASVVERENAKVVVALGTDALGEALRLPSSVSVVYGLVAAPPHTARSGITGVYMSPPVSEYVSVVRKYLPFREKVAVVGSQRMMKSLWGGANGDVSAYYVDTSADLLSTVSGLGDSGAILLLPDAQLLTASVMEKVFLFSFRNNVPLLGISEAHVKNGALLSFVFDPKSVGKQIVEKVHLVLDGTDAGEIPASPPRRYNLYVNSKTARKMGIELPDELLRKAKRVYN